MIWWTYWYSYTSAFYQNFDEKMLKSGIEENTMFQQMIIAKYDQVTKRTSLTSKRGINILKKNWEKIDVESNSLNQRTIKFSK